MGVWQYVLIFVGAIAVTLGAERIWKWFRRRLVAATVPEAGRGELPMPAPVPMPVQETVPVSGPVVAVIEPRPKREPEHPPMPRYDPIPDEVETYLRANRQEGDAGRAAIEAAITKGIGHIAEDDILGDALAMGYAAADVAAVMVARHYQPEEIADLLAKKLSLTANELGDILAPFVEGTIPMRAERIYAIAKNSLDLDGEDDDLIALPVHLGCSKEEAAGVLYRKTDLSFSSVLSELELWDGGTVAKLEEELGTNIADPDEYKNVREEKEFSEAAAILRACKNGPEAIIRAECEYDQLSGPDALGDIFTALTSAGFSDHEIMSGIIAAEVMDEDQYGNLVVEALDRRIPMEEIVLFLTEEGVDPDSLDEELRNVDQEIGPRIEVLHAFLHAAEVPTAG